MELITEQGEGVTGHFFDEDDEIAHYYRFQQLVLGRYYREGDTHGSPAGGDAPVDWNAVYPLTTNARVAADNFSWICVEFLNLLTRAFNGEPPLVVEAVGGMFRLQELSLKLLETNDGRRKFVLVLDAEPPTTVVIQRRGTASAPSPASVADTSGSPGIDATSNAGRYRS